MYFKTIHWNKKTCRTIFEFVQCCVSSINGPNQARPRFFPTRISICFVAFCNLITFRLISHPEFRVLDETSHLLRFFFTLFHWLFSNGQCRKHMNVTFTMNNERMHQTSNPNALAGVQILLALKRKPLEPQEKKN